MVRFDDIVETTRRLYPMYGGMRVELVADDDALADPRIPKSVLAELKQDMALIAPTGCMLYVRKSSWERYLERHFKPAAPSFP